MVPPRERGKYQGALGAVFGVTLAFADGLRQGVEERGQRASGAWALSGFRDRPAGRETVQALARHLPGVTDRIVSRPLAGRVRSGAFAGAELAAALVDRHARP